VTRNDDDDDDNVLDISSIYPHDILLLNLISETSVASSSEVRKVAMLELLELKRTKMGHLFP
jgi:hypothetical protein